MSCRRRLASPSCNLWSGKAFPGVSRTPTMETTMSESFTATFPAMYYSSPVNQMAAGIGIESNDSLTAAMTAGAPYFTITSIDVCNVLPVITPPLPPGEAPANPRLPSPPKATPTGSTKLSAPVATSDGVKPLSVLKGQYARLWITANVPKGALPPGAFSGTAVVTGKNATYTVTLKGAYLGTLMGNVTVQPATVAPGQPVLVQVCDASGKPISDPTVTVTIQGVQATARYYQFPTVGIRNFIVRAVRGPLSETSQATVNVAGTPLGFRLSLAPP